MIEIVTDKEFLRKKFTLSDNPDETLKTLKENFNRKKYVGLAAPQIRIEDRAAVVLDKRKYEWLDIVDWKITEKLFPFDHEESCLSLPGKIYKVTRYRQITIDDENGREYVSYMGEDEEDENFNITTIAIQHEIDHLNGVLLEDIAKSVKTVKIAGRKQESGKKRSMPMWFWKET